MACLLKLLVLLMASSCAVSASAEQTYSRKADAGVALPKFHPHGGLLSAGHDMIMAVEEVVMRMLMGDAAKKAKREAAKKKKLAAKKKKLQNATNKCKKTKKCSALRNTKGECGAECMKCAKTCAKAAMKRMAGHASSGGSASGLVAALGGYYAAAPDSPGYYNVLLPGPPTGTR